jgi:hypothetical protein
LWFRSSNKLNTALTNQSAPRLGVQFGTYASSLAFFGLTQLPSVSEDFTGIVDYASSMALELITNSSASETSYLTPDKISVRFMFSNGSATEHSLIAYPLFGLGHTVLPWKTFAGQMSKIAIGDRVLRCSACGNTTGACAAYVSSSTSDASSPSGISTAVAGVICVMVALGMILGIEALTFLIGGLRMVGKKRMASRAAIEGENVSLAKV